MLPRLLVVVGFVVILLGCTHTTHTTISAQTTIYEVPEVDLVGKTESLPENALADFKKTHLSAGRCVYKGAVHDLYWQDDQKVDAILLLPSGSRSYDVYKVTQTTQRVLRETTGTKNGKPFHSERLEAAK
jgi:hypothetical protein